MSKKVAMFVTNPCTHDARVMKEASTLADSGYDVRVYALSNAYNDPGIFEQDGYTVHRLKFDNIIQRARDVLWGSAYLLLKPFVFLIGLVRSLIIATSVFVVTALGALFGSIFLFLNIPLKVATDKSIEAEPKTLEDIRTSFLARTEKMFRVAKVKVYLWTKPRFLRVVTSGFLQALALVEITCFFLIKLVFFITRKTLGLAKVSYRKLKRLFRLTRSYVIKRVNRLVYKLLLPVHKISTYYFFCVSSAKEAKTWGATIAHAHDLNTMYASHILKKDNSDLKVVYDSHELWIHRNRVGRRATVEKMIDRVVERWLIRKADVIITVCQSIADWLRSRYPKIPEPIVLRNMPHRFVDTGTSMEKQTLKKRLGIPDDDLVMIYTGKITSGRGIEIGITALSEVPNLQMVMLGYGEDSYVADIKKMTRELGLSDRVTFCEPVPHKEVTAFIYGADFALVYIEPICLSYEYALPNKLFESIQAGIPIVGSNLVEIKNIVEGLDVGFCFSTPEDIAKEISENVTIERVAFWRERIGKVREELCWDIEQLRLTEAYKTLES